VLNLAEFNDVKKALEERAAVRTASRGEYTPTFSGPESVEAMKRGGSEAVRALRFKGL
jgi:hypothetical protein